MGGLGQLRQGPLSQGPCKEGDKKGIRVHLEARMRLPERPVGLTKYLRKSGTHNKVGSSVFKNKQTNPTLKIKLVIEMHILLYPVS